MSATIWDGESRSLSIETGKKLTAVAMSGTYSVLTTAGAGAGTALATNATGGTYGPYAGPITVLLSSSALSEIDFDVAVTPVIESDTFVKASKTLTGGNIFSGESSTLKLSVGETDLLHVVDAFFASGAGWSRVFDGATDTTRVVQLAVQIPASKLSPNCTIRLTHYWTEVGTSSKNIIVGLNDTSASKSFSVVSSNTGIAVFTVNEIQFRNSLSYPQVPNQGFAGGGSNNGPVVLPVDAGEGLELLFYTYANAMLTSAESVTLENVKVEILK